METLHVSLFSVVEDLAHDWLYLQRHKHSRHILGVHSFVLFDEIVKHSPCIFLAGLHFVSENSEDKISKRAQ